MQQDTDKGLRQGVVYFLGDAVTFVAQYGFQGSGAEVASRGYNTRWSRLLMQPLTVTEPMLVNIQTLIDEAKCYETIRQIR